MSVENDGAVRDTAEYAEMVTDFFVESVRKAATRAMAGNYKGEDITPSLMEALQHIYLRGASAIREIAAAMEISLSAASQLVERLVKKELVTRREDASDRRLTCVELTDFGRDVVKAMRQRRSAWFNSIVSAMPKADQEYFLEGLESFLQVSLADEENLDRACIKCGMEHVSSCVISKIKIERAESRK